jgi:hypothetical protein
LVNGETLGSVTLESTGQAPTAGVLGSPYAIVPSNVTGGTFTPSNYSISYVNGALTVTPAPLTITAQDVSKVYGQTPVLSGFDSSALVNGETLEDVTLISNGQVATSSVAGSPYAIIPSNATGGTFTPSNYSISYVNGVLVVTPAVVVPPIEPPELVDPEVVPPDIPVVVEPVVVPPSEPPSVVTTNPEPSTISEKQALPTMPKRDARPLLLTVIPPLPLVQGPVTQASIRDVTQAPMPVPVPVPVPITTPLPAPLATITSPTVVQEEVKPQVPLPVVTLRRPKQDRN